MTKAKPAAASKAKAAAAKAPEGEEAAVGAAVNAKHANYSAADLKKVKKLEAEGVDLTGEESSEELDAKLAALEPSEGESSKEDKDCPDKVPARFEVVKVDNKDKKFFIHFVFVNNGKAALYNEVGQRISPVVAAGSAESSQLSKNAARNNAHRRASMRPSDFPPA